jgi:phosphatidylinositol alpha-1,6-mannosyltransferase
VRFAGFVPYDELPAHFAAGDIFAMPCRSRFRDIENEGLGAVFLQAAAVGRPVIAGSCGGAPEAVRHGKTGLVVDGRDGADIDQAILRLLRAPDEARAFGANGAAWVHDEMTWEQMGRRLQTLLEEVTSSPAAVSTAAR